MVSLYEKTTAVWLLHERQPGRPCQAFTEDVVLQALLRDRADSRCSRLQARHQWIQRSERHAALDKCQRRDDR